MMYNIIFAPQFKRDLEETFEYISNSLASPQAAKRLMSEFDSSIVRTADEPYLYPLCPEPLNTLGLRKIVIKNYIAVYYVNENTKSVNFLRLFYGRQNYLVFFK